MHAPEFIPGLMWDHEACDTPPYTPPGSPAADRLQDYASPAPFRKETRALHRRGFPRLLSIEIKNPLDEHIFHPLISSSSNGSRPSSAHHGTTSNPTITPAT